ncbi:hypothetical protein IAT38_000741 [Cryptococcus sp. DSM 104549]
MTSVFTDDWRDANPCPSPRDESEPDESPPYHTNDANARVGFKDLPEDVITETVGYLRNKKSLMMTCKQTCFVVGDQIYATLYCQERKPVFVAESRTSYSENHKGHHLEMLLDGLDNEEPSKTRPFGRALKVRFLSQLRELRISVDWSKGAQNGGMARFAEDLRYFIDLFNELQDDEEHLDPFLRLKAVIISAEPSHTRAGDAVRSLQRDFALAFAEMCRPTTWTWRDIYETIPQGSPFFPSAVSDIPHTALSLAPRPRHGGLRFAGGHLPALVKHDWHVPPDDYIPIPCYGTRNIILRKVCLPDPREDDTILYALRHVLPDCCAGPATQSLDEAVPNTGDDLEAEETVPGNETVWEVWRDLVLFGKRDQGTDEYLADAGEEECLSLMAWLKGYLPHLPDSFEIKTPKVSIHHGHIH